MIVTDDGCRLWTTEVGAGAPLVVVHGGPGLWDMFGDLARSLSAEARVIRWDQRGGGRSERRGPYSVARMVADLDVVRRHFGLDRIAVLGHSWGARLALEYALAFPERVESLVYLAGTGLGNDWHEEFRANFRRGLGTAYERYAEAMATPWFPINYECNAAIGVQTKARPEAELVAACRRLIVPTLIMDGELDPRPRWAVDSLAAALPLVTRVRFPDAGHAPWLDAPEPFYAALHSHLASASRG